MSRNRQYVRTIRATVPLFPFLAAVTAVFILLAPVSHAKANEVRDLNDSPENSIEWAKSLETGEPISAASGDYYFQIPLFNLGGPLPLDYTLTYHVHQITTGAYGNRFDQNVATAVRVSSGLTLYPYGPNGDILRFTRTGGVWTVKTNTSIRYVLKETGADNYTGYYYLMDPVRERVLIFEKRQIEYTTNTRGVLCWVMDRKDNRLTYTYQGTSTTPGRIEDGLGRCLDFSLSGGQVDAVTDQGGRQYAFTYDTARIVTMTDPLGNATRFEYPASVEYDMEQAITRKILPKGNAPYTQAYDMISFVGDTDVRVTSQTDAYGNTTTFSYDSNAGTVTESRPEGNHVVYKHYNKYGNPETFTDPTGKTMSFTQTTNEQISGISDRLGDTTAMTYHAETGLNASTTNAKGDVMSHTYTAQDQTFTNPGNAEQVTFAFYKLSRTDYPDGTSEQFTYDANGNLLTRTDRAGGVWTNTYNGMGQVLTETNPAGGVKTYTYNADGTVASMTDSDTGTTTYAYDVYKRPIRTTHPDASSVERTYDLMDRVTSTKDENGNTTTYTYDANGNQTVVRDPALNQTQYEFDLMDRLTKTTDRLGNSTTRTYDNMERLSSTTDANGLATTYGYDTMGRQTSMTLGGRTSRTGYDDEGVVSSRTTPLGYTTSYQTDRLGHVTAMTDPLLKTTTYTRDKMGRMTSATDPLNRTTTYTYDSRGLLSDVSLPTVGTAAYQYDALGQLSQITDLNGKNWTFTYTAMGRKQSDTDPSGNTRQYAYNNRGRLTQTTYPDGGTETLTYDVAGNTTRRQYSDGTDIPFTYNSLNQLTGTGGISFTRDAEGQIIGTDNPGTVFGATYDAGGRLKTASYNNNAFTVTYNYDAATGLLTGVADDLTGTQVTFTYDNDFRITAITRSNGVNGAFTYDTAGRLTRIQEGSIIDLQYTLDQAGQVTAVNLTAPLDPASLISGSTDSFTYDPASQVNTAGYTYDKRGRLRAWPGHTTSWDGASRLTGLDSATFTYNGLGDLVTRAEAGTTIHYYYNYAISLKPIVAERNDATSAFIRYYVWTPDGRLLYMIDVSAGNKVYYYHFDRIGSTVTLTDATGAVTDAYAYTPYGKILQHTGANPQPFTFVGQWGGRQEGTSGSLYHMRDRYYDATTARFISRDPVWPSVAAPQTINPYQYALQNPIRYIDETGQKPCELPSLWENILIAFGLMEDPVLAFLERMKQEDEERKQRALEIQAENIRRDQEREEREWQLRQEYNRRMVEANPGVCRIANDGTLICDIYMPTCFSEPLYKEPTNKEESWEWHIGRREAPHKPPQPQYTIVTYDEIWQQKTERERERNRLRRERWRPQFPKLPKEVVQELRSRPGTFSMFYRMFSGY